MSLEPNAYSRVYSSWLEVVVADDWDAVEAMQSEDVTLEDRRPGLQHHLSGRDALLHSQRAARDQDYRVGSVELIGTGGESIGLHRIVWQMGVDSESEMLVLGWLADDERLDGWVVFEPSQMEAALSELRIRS
jgi:hypothetical protein